MSKTVSDSDTWTSLSRALRTSYTTLSSSDSSSEDSLDQTMSDVQ